jgi:hypothetical protein
MNRHKLKKFVAALIFSTAWGLLMQSIFLGFVCLLGWYIIDIMNYVYDLFYKD